MYCAMACMAVAVMTGCGGNKPTKTIENLKAAADGESTASAKYAAFAARATADGYPAIAAMFKATSESEAIHAKNHLEILGQYNEEYDPVVAEFQVDSTAANLKVAILGETEEFEAMYPEYIKIATEEGAEGAIRSFTYANDTEKSHAAIYANALANLETPQVLPVKYYVCGTCGNTYATTAPEQCDLCKAPSSTFIIEEAVVPVYTPEETADKADRPKEGMPLDMLKN